MNQERLTRSKDLNLESSLWRLDGGLWKPQWSGNSSDAIEIVERQREGFQSLSFVSGVTESIEEEAKQDDRGPKSSRARQDALGEQSEITISEFVERRFVPGHVALKEAAGREHYQAMLKHILKPEEVDRIFCTKSKQPSRRLKTVSGWPYLGHVRLCDLRPEHVHLLTSAALAKGYSIQTARHIQFVVSAIFSYARHIQCFLGDNPTRLLKLPEMNRKRTDSLTLGQLREALGAMQYPEKEVTLFAALTGMNLAEIIGLQWKRVNLSGAEVMMDGKLVPPRTIAVRKRWSRGALDSVASGRVRNLPIPRPLLDILLKLRDRGRFTGPDDFVLVSQEGTPINQKNIRERRLRPIARQLGLPSISWQVFLRTRKALVSQFGLQFQVLAANIEPPDTLRDESELRNWHCRIQRRRT